MSQSRSLPGIEVLYIDNIEALANRLPKRHRYFTVLLAWDVPEIDQQRLVDLFRPLVDLGLAYFCAWGKRSSEVHDAVDICAVEKEIEIGESDYLLMTTWHADESLEEAAWFFKMLAVPSENHVFADFDRFAVAVGNPDWAHEMGRYLFEGTTAKAPAQ
jgi:hypothetical protein